MLTHFSLAGTLSAECEESKLIELKNAAEDLLPALVLLLGSFTQFIRCSMLEKLPDGDEAKTAYLQLLAISSSYDDNFTHYTIQPTEIAEQIKDWKSTSFHNYPPPRSWREMASPDTSAEEVTNKVIAAHCNTLSESAPGWSTVIPLRHLHMTLVRLTTDLARYSSSSI